MATGSWTGTSPRGVYKPAMNEKEGTSTTGAWKNFDTSLDNVHNKLWRDNVINPTCDYSCAGEGTTDDTTNFHAAVSALSDGDTLFLAPGDIYSITSSASISNKNDITIIGYGAELRFPTTVSANDWLLDISGCTNITILGLRFNGQTASITGVKTSAIYITDSQVINIVLCDFSDCNYGVFTQVTSGTVEEIHVDHCRQIGTNDYSVTNDANEVLDGVCVYHEDLASKCSVKNCYGYQVHSLIQAGNAPEFQACDNWAIETHDSSIYLGGPRQIVRGNFVIDAGKDGIKAENETTSDKSIFTENYIKGAGVHIATGGSMMFLYDNSVISNNVFVYDDPTNRTSTGLSGASVYGPNVSVTGNTFEGWNISDANARGINIVQSDKNVRGVTVGHNTFSTIYRIITVSGDATNTTETVKISDNTLYNFHEGVFAYNDQGQSSMKNIEVKNNLFDTYDGYAIDFQNCDSPKVIGNEFVNGHATTGKAIRLHESINCVYRDNHGDGADNTFFTQSGTTTYHTRRNNWDGATEELTNSETKDWGSIADGDEEAEEVTVTGAALGDYALASMSIDITDLVINAAVTGSDTVTVVMANNTGGAIDLGSGTLYVKVIKR